MGRYFRLILAGCIVFAGCAPVGTPVGGEDKYGCEEPPPNTFTSVGVDAHFAHSIFSKLVTGAVDVKTDPSVVALASQAVRSARLRDKIRCLAIHRDKFNTAQIIYLDHTNAFLETKPTPEDFIEWQQKNPFPSHSEEQIKILEREVDKVRGQVTKSEQDLHTLQDRVRHRRLTASQWKSVAVSLAQGEQGEIHINFIYDNSESEQFANDIGRALETSGWAIARVGPAVFLGGTPVGLQIVAKDPQSSSVQSLYSALLEIAPKTNIKTNPNLDRQIHLNVGSKP